MKKVAHSSLADSMPRKIIDQSAETVEELSNATGQGLNWVRKYAAEQVGLRKWEQVWKKDGRRIVPAFRASNQRTKP